MRFGKLQLRRRPREGAKFHDLGENRQPFEVRQSGHLVSNSETMSFDSFYF
jgi:hypothetical protein